MALLSAGALVFAACGSDDGGTTSDTAADSAETTAATEETSAETTAAPAETTAAASAEGGTLVLGAEQEPDCADWISSCAGASWGYWTMNVQTMPRAFDAVKDGEDWVYAPNSMLAGEPELVTDPQQVVTYAISEDAVWNDGEPITSSDFKYTWDAIANGDDIYDKTGYTNIESVDDSDPKVAVVTFATPYAGWKGLFGGGYGIYPSHLLEGKDHLAEMGNGYSFSGGPWIIEAWNKGVDVTLVPNENFWGTVPTLDKVVFRFVPDTASEFAAYRAGEVLAIYPQPQIDVVDAVNAGIEGNSSFSDQTGNYEALWLNNAKPPFDSVAVRQAFAYSIDRDAVVEALFGGLGLTEALQTINAPILSSYSDTEAFAGYTLDLAKVDELMTGDGWAKNGSGIWEKAGATASIEFTTTAGNARRALTQQVVQEQAAAAGFDVTLKTLPAGDFFGQALPAGDYQMGLYAQVLTAIDPALCNSFCSKNIPSAENDNSGTNWTRTNIPELDPLLEIVDTSLDEEERATANKEAERIIAENVASIPLDPLPNILLWSDQIVGPVADNPILGPFNNMNEWSLAS
jgi:peptide/nickel transport system substrate-binding protein